MDYRDLNSDAWDEEVKRNNYWTRIASKEEIDNARDGDVQIRVSPMKYVPLEWINGTKGKDVLLLAGGGGQQTPILASFGAVVTTLDNSQNQLNQDKIALSRFDLSAKLIKGSMDNIELPDDSFDYVINPVSINFVDSAECVFKEVNRVLRKDGTFIFGVANPVLYLFDEKIQEKKLKIKYTLPFSDETAKSEKEKKEMIKHRDTFEFSHTLDSLIGGLLRSGFIIDGFYSDGADSEPTDSYIYDSYLVFKARKI